MAILCSECQYSHAEKVERCKRCKFPFSGEWPSLVSRTINNYQLVRRVGGGGFGAVYEARHIALGNSFAVKILHPRLAQDVSFTTRFQAEARVLAELQHENVLQVIDFGFSEGIGFYLITEWLEGNSLFRVLRSYPKPERGWIWELFSQLLDALAYAHTRGIIHRDLKPENLVLITGSRGRMVLKIVDFGIAQIVAGQGAEEQERSKYAVGTPFYMAPEQVRGEVGRIGPHTDLYACGVILAEMLTGQRPFDGGGQRETMRLQLEAMIPRLAELDPEDTFPDNLENLVQTASHKEIEQRFQSATAFSQALDTVMKDCGFQQITEDIYQNVKEASPPVTRKPRRQIQYRKKNQASGGLWVWMFVGLAVLSMGLVGWMWFSMTPSAKTSSPATKKPPKRRKLVVLTSWEQGSGVSSPRSRVEHGSERVAGTLGDLDGGVAGVADADLTDVSTDTVDASVGVEPSIPRPRDREKSTKSPDRQSPSPVRRRKTRSLPRRRTPPPPVEVRKTENRPLILLRLLSKPKGADVWVDDRKRGTTPTLLQVERGRSVSIVFKKKGYVSKTLTLTPVRSTQQSVTLIEDLF